MKTKYLLVLSVFFVSCLLFSSCAPILKLIYGYHDPDYTSHQDIKKFQQKIGLGDSDYFGIKPEEYISMKDHSFPNLYVFDKNGRYINYHDTIRPNCNGPADQFLAELDPVRNYNYSDTYTLTNFLKLLEGSQCKSAILDYDAGVDFIVFLNFATFAGKKIHKQSTSKWFDALQKNSRVKHTLFLINDDLKECWSLEQRKFFEK